MSKNTTLHISLFGLPYFKRLRLTWCIHHLIRFGLLRRAELMQAFEVSEATASHDFAALQRIAPAMLRYDKSLKAYVVTHVKVNIKGGVYGFHNRPI